jgi:acetyl-CoA acetyltransferase
MGEEAARKALDDSGIDYGLVEQAAIGYCYGDSTAGQRALYKVGLSGIPILNVNNNCSTGSSALYLAKNFIAGGLADCTLALGFEKMEKGSLGVKYIDRASPMGKFFSKMNKLRGVDRKAPGAPQMFGNAGREYMERYGVKAESFARIGEKNHRHSANNPYSQFRDVYTLKEIMDAPMVWDPLTKLQCCPTSDGGGAAVLASERFVREHGLEAKAVEIIGQAMTTDTESTFAEGDMKLVGMDMTKAAARSVYEQSGVGPEQVDVVELHDCFSANEMITYEGLGLCAEGKAGEMIDSGAVTYGGQVVVNPSGGLISKGHPLGATGLAQCAELSWQLRGEAEARQVDGAKIALQHNLGLGGACVVTMYRKADLA